jgi:hypothetical protein
LQHQLTTKLNSLKEPAGVLSTSDKINWLIREASQLEVIRERLKEKFASTDVFTPIPLERLKKEASKLYAEFLDKEVRLQVAQTPPKTPQFEQVMKLVANIDVTELKEAVAKNKVDTFLKEKLEETYPGSTLPLQQQQQQMQQQLQWQQRLPFQAWGPGGLTPFGLLQQQMPYFQPQTYGQPVSQSFGPPSPTAESQLHAQGPGGASAGYDPRQVYYSDETEQSFKQRKEQAFSSALDIEEFLALAQITEADIEDRTRRQISSLLNADRSVANITSNFNEALNLVLKGMPEQEARDVMRRAANNYVLRVLYDLEDNIRFAGKERFKKLHHFRKQWEQSSSTSGPNWSV